MRNVFVRWVLFCGVPCALIVLATLQSTMPDCPSGASCGNGAFLVLFVSSALLSLLSVLWLAGLCAYALAGRRDSKRADASTEAAVPLLWARSLIAFGALPALVLVGAVDSSGCAGPGCEDALVVAVAIWLAGVTALAWSWLGREPRFSLTLASVAFVSASVGAAVSYG